MAYSSYPAMPTQRPSYSDRVSPAARAAISSALLLSTIVLWYVRVKGWAWLGMPPTSVGVRVWVVAFIAVLDAYFIVVVMTLARIPSRRTAAILVALFAVVVDLVSSVAGYALPHNATVRWGSIVLDVVTLVMFVAAWGLARRRRSAWYFGLVPAFVVAALAVSSFHLRWGYDLFGRGFETWYVAWFVWMGSFALGCVICWLFDIGTPKVGGGPPPGHYPQQGAWPSGAHPPTAYPPQGPYQVPGSYSNPGAYPPQGGWTPPVGNPW